MLRTRFSVFAGAAAFALTLVAPAMVTTAATPSEIIDQRKAFMSLQGAATAGIQAALKAGDMAAVARMAQALASSAEVIPSFFEKGTGSEAGQTKALPAIWEKPDEFKADASTLKTESAKLAEVAKGGDAAAAAAQFAQMGKVGCGGCHTSFRAR